MKNEAGFENGRSKASDLTLPMTSLGEWEALGWQSTLLGEIFREAQAESGLEYEGPWDQRKKSPADSVISGFGFDKWEFPADRSLAAQARQSELVRIAQLMLSTGVRKILLVGHTDPVGGHDYNVRLGKRRAATIRRLSDLTLEGIRKGSSRGVHYDIDSPGETEPVKPNDSESNRAQNRRVAIFLPAVSGTTRLPVKPVPPSGPTPPTATPQPTTKQPPPPYRPPIPAPLPFPDPWNIDLSAPKIGTRSHPTHWVWTALQSVASVLGITLSTGLRLLPTVVLEEAIAAALLELGALGVTAKAALGAAGEAIARVVIEHELAKQTGGVVFNLNGVQRNFPVFDLIWHDGITSVKTYGGLIERSYEAARSDMLRAFRETIGMQEKWETASGPQKLTKAARALWNQRDKLVREADKALPSAIRSAKSVEQIEAYLRANGTLRVPDDYVTQLRRDAAGFLKDKWSPTNKRLLGPEGIRISRRIEAYIFRIQGIGMPSGDIRSMVEVSQELEKVRKKLKP